MIQYYGSYEFTKREQGSLTAALIMMLIVFWAGVGLGVYIGGHI